MICTPPIGWHMRAATWATYRDIAAARLSWERARAIADALPAEDPNRTAMRIAPAHHAVRDRLASPCERGGRSLRGIAGVVHRRRGQGVAGHRHGGAGDRSRVPGPDPRGVAAGIGSHGPSLESIGDPTLTVGLSFPVIYAKAHSGEWSDVLRWSQRVIDLADGDPSKGELHYRVSVSARLYDAGYGPVLPGSSRMAQTTCATAWPWPAAPTRCPTPWSSPTSTSREYRLACCCRRSGGARDRGCAADCRTIR